MILQQMKARVVDRRRKSMSSNYRATYPTGVIGRYGASAMVLYGARFTAAGLAFTALWFDIRRNRLRRAHEDEACIRSTTIRILIGPVISYRAPLERVFSEFAYPVARARWSRLNRPLP